MRHAIYIMVIFNFFFGFYLSVGAATIQQNQIEPAAQQIGNEDNTDLQTVPEAELRELFSQYVCDSLGKIPEDAIVSRFKVTGNRPVPSGVLEYQVFQKSKGTPMGYVRLIAIVSVDGISRNEVRLSGWVDVFGPALCSVRSMQKGEIIEKSDVYLDRKNISRMSSNILTDKSMAVGLVLKNNLNENASLKEWMLKRNPTIDRGDRVTILAELGGLRVTVPGRTLAKGFVGDVIRVQNTMSRKNLFARIIDNATVAVEF